MILLSSHSLSVSNGAKSAAKTPHAIHSPTRAGRYNTQLTLFGGFAPNSSSAETLSKAMGSRTVMTGSVSRSRNDPSQSLQMIERPLMTPDELKSLPKGEFIVMKTGVHPMRVKLKLFFKCGIEFDEKHPYTVPDNGGRTVQYAEKKDLQDGIMKKYHPKEYAEMQEAKKAAGGGSGQSDTENIEPLYEHHQSEIKDKKSGGLIIETDKVKIHCAWSKFRLQINREQASPFAAFSAVSSDGDIAHLSA